MWCAAGGDNVPIAPCNPDMLCSNTRQHHFPSIETVITVAEAPASFFLRNSDSLEKVRAHSPLSAIPLQTPYASIRRLLTWIVILAECFAVVRIHQLLVLLLHNVASARSTGWRTCRTWRLCHRTIHLLSRVWVSPTF